MPQPDDQPAKLRGRLTRSTVVVAVAAVVCFGLSLTSWFDNGWGFVTFFVGCIAAARYGSDVMWWRATTKVERSRP